MEEKLPEFELRVSHSFDIKIVSTEKKAFKGFGAPSSLLPVNFLLFQNLVLYMRYQGFFFAVLKLYL